jgi:hypothetical protein
MRTWEDNIKIDVRETGCDDVDCIYLAHDRSQGRALENTVMNFQVHKRLRMS